MNPIEQWDVKLFALCEGAFLYNSKGLKTLSKMFQYINMCSWMKLKEVFLSNYLSLIR